MAAPRLIEPPFYDPPLTDAPGGDQQHSQSWKEFYQAVSDKLTNLYTGVTDGSDAAAGNIGEYMTSLGTLASLADNTLTPIAGITLSPGDWDVSGYAVFVCGSGAHIQFSVGIDAIDTVMTATMPSSAITQAMNTRLYRMNVTTPTNTQIVVQGTFTGTVAISAGAIHARRMR